MSITKAGSHDEPGGQRNVPPPTIVGPRPAAGAPGQIAVPRGLERLLTLAGLNAEWQRKALADPLQAAGEAQIELSPSEAAILQALPRQTLGQMILSFARNRLTPMRDTALAAGAAAAALLATTGYGEPPEMATDGIRPNVPRPRTEKVQPGPNAIRWETALATALTQAAASNRAVMVICPLGAQVIKPAGPPGSRGITIEIPRSPFLAELCEQGNAAVAEAVAAAGLIAFKPPPGEEHPYYLARLEKFGVRNVAPLVFFLAPDGTMLSQLVQPANEDKLVQAIRAVPPRLAAWMAKQRPPVTPAPPATKGMRSL